jgi:hypothetical protein
LAPTTIDPRRHLPLACLALSIIGCQSPTAPGLKVAIVNGHYVFACGSWAPSAPPVRRTLMDIGVTHGVDSPDGAAVAEIEAAAGRTVYRFHGNLVRVELDVATVQTLAGFPIRSEPILYAITVADPSSRSVRLAVARDHNVHAQDLDALTALGAAILSAYSFSKLVGIRIEDGRVPEVPCVGRRDGSLHRWTNPLCAVTRDRSDNAAVANAAPGHCPEGRTFRGTVRAGTRARDLARSSKTTATTTTALSQLVRRLLLKAG